MEECETISVHAKHIPTLDGWRGIAILLLLIDHSLVPTFPAPVRTHLGAHAVQIFFVLSGYLITGKLLEDGSLKRFYTRRAFRILPVVLTYLTAVSILGFGLHAIPVFSTEIASSLLFVRNFHIGGGPFTGHLWSLSVEEQFYLLWPALMLWLVKVPPRQRFLLALWPFVFGVPVFLFSGTFQFYAGLAVGCVLRLGFSDIHTNAVIRRVFSGRSLLAVGTFAAYLAIFHFKLTIIDPVICGVGLCATLVEPRALVGRFLELSVLRWIGRLSYSLYIWQELLLPYHWAGSLSRFPINLATVVGISCLSYYLIERPMMRLGQSIASREAMVATAPAPRLLPEPISATAAALSSET